MNNNRENNRLMLCIALFCVVALPCYAQEQLVNAYNPQELLTALDNSDPALREKAACKFAVSTGLLTMDKVLPIALIAMKDGQAKVRLCAINGLALSAYVNPDSAKILKDAVPALLERFNDSDPEVRTYAAAIVSLMQPNPPPEIVPALITLLNDANIKVAQAATDSLSIFDPDIPNVADSLLVMASHPNPVLQSNAIRNISNFWQGRDDIDPEVVLTLIKALTNKDKNIRTRAAYALGRFGYNAEDAIPTLEKLKADPEESKDMRAVAESSLRMIKGESEPPPPQLRYDDYRQDGTP